MLLLVSSNLMAQMPDAITITPEYSSAFDEMTLTLDVRKSCPDSAMFDAETVMMHSGVEIDGAGWQHVVGFDETGANGQQPILTYNGDSTWSFTFVPADFYGIAEGTDVTAITCVFNAGSWTAGEAKDKDAEGNCTDFIIPLSLVGIGEGFDISSVSFYPNPVNDVLNIENLKDVNAIEIYSVSGKRVMMIDNISSAKLTISTSTLQSGMYLIKLHSNGNSQTTKFIKN